MDTALTALTAYGIYKLFDSIFDNDTKPPTRSGASNFDARSEQVSAVASAIRATSFGRVAVETITGTIDLLHGAGVGALPIQLPDHRPEFGHTRLYGVGMILGASYGLWEDARTFVAGIGGFGAAAALTLETGGAAAPTLVLPTMAVGAALWAAPGHLENFKNGINFAKAEGPRQSSTPETAAKPGRAYPGNDPAKAPEGFEWRGRPGSQPGSKDGNWFNPKTRESMRPDLDHPSPIGPHWDYRGPEGDWSRLFPDGSVVPK